MVDAVFNHCGRKIRAVGGCTGAWERFPLCGLVYDRRLEQIGKEQTPETIGVLLLAFTDAMPKLNTNNEEVIEYFCVVCEEWIRKFDIDGIRLTWEMKCLIGS